MKAAEPAASSWRSYVDARTEFEVGDLSADERADRYTSAVDAARSQLASFTALERGYQDVGDVCAGLDETAGMPSEALQRCITRAKAADVAATTARNLVAEWRQQIVRVDQLADGKLSREQYDTAWTDAWLKAPANLDQFFGPKSNQFRDPADQEITVRQALERAPACSL